MTALCVCVCVCVRVCVIPGDFNVSRWGYYTFLVGSVIDGIYEKRQGVRFAEIWKYVSRIKDFIRFTMKCPVNIRQQTVHTAYMGQVINNENINRMFVTKPHNVATSSISSFMNLIKSD